MISGRLPSLIAALPAAVGILTFINVLICVLRGWVGELDEATRQRPRPEPRNDDRAHRPLPLVCPSGWTGHVTLPDPLQATGKPPSTAVSKRHRRSRQWGSGPPARCSDAFAHRPMSMGSSSERVVLVCG